MDRPSFFCYGRRRWSTKPPIRKANSFSVTARFPNWLDYLRAFAGTEASVLIVQSQCDTRDKRIRQVDDFPFHRFTEVSAYWTESWNP
jgi:hypothetical protein